MFSRCVPFVLKRTMVQTTMAYLERRYVALEKHGLRPHVLLCDYNLRGSPDGVETSRRPRAALGRNVPAVVMTGDTRSQVDSISARGVAVLIKPFLTEDLPEALGSRAPRAIKLEASVR
jgi:CheY-like chemotaxis protein